MNRLFVPLMLFGIIGTAGLATSCGGKQDTNAVKDNETPAEAPARGSVVDKSGDTTLQQMIKEVAPLFSQATYSVPGTDRTVAYNLYVPQNVQAGKKYPMVVFIADASTAGKDVKVPLTQGYGALVWATPESQAKNPCYVLVPQFGDRAVNDDYKHSQQVDDVIGLVKDITATNSVDAKRIYSTGQSMGGMISMYYDVAYPDVFAASIFVDCHWDAATFDKLVKHKFVWFIAGDKGKAYSKLAPMEEAARKEGVQYTTAAWSARLPMSQQDELAAVMLEKGAPVNIFEFETGSVLPEGVEGMDHMYSFDYAYRNTAVRDWLFKQSR